MIATEIYETAIHFAKQRKIKTAFKWLDYIYSQDTFSHSEHGPARRRGVRSEAEEEDVIQRNCLRINIENSIGMNRQLAFFHLSGSIGHNGDVLNRRMDDLHVRAGSPRTTDRSYGIYVPT